MALDFDNLDDALRLAEKLAPVVGLFKVNTHLFTAAGPEALIRLHALGPQIFLDLKFHDIPNTVAGAVAAAAHLPGVALIDLHITGGPAMMKAGAEALSEASKNNILKGKARPHLLGITVLTSLDQTDLKRIGLTGTPGARALSLARLAKDSGLDGVVASPLEARQIRNACGPDFLIVVPGIRPASHNKSARTDDQSRTASPAEAIRAGADYLVIGRPITAAPDPLAAATQIAEEIASAQK